MVEAIIRWRWWIVAAWLVCAAAMLLFVPPSDPQLYEPVSFLPMGVPSRQAAEAMREAFPTEGGFAQAMLVFERPDGPLSPADLAFIEDIARRMASPPDSQQKALFEGVRVLSPAMIPLAENPLISPVSAAGQAALIRVTIPTSFITVRTMKIVQHIRAQLLEAHLESRQLRAAVSGSAGFGSDYAEAVERSHRRTLTVTILAVAAILGLVQRAPLAALLPLAAISMAAIVAVSILSLLQRAGLHTGPAENLFVIVLIYGAGVDYVLLLSGRYRELLARFAQAPDVPPAAAAGLSLKASGATILAAAGTNILAMLMLLTARHNIVRSTGPAVAIALTAALAATLTLVPALMAISGRWLFWPTRPTAGPEQGRLWPAVATAVTRRPLAVMLITLAVLLAPALRGMHLEWVYDALASLDARWDDGVGNSIAGSQVARRHWPVGELAPIQILIVADEPLPAQTWRAFTAHLTQRLAELRLPGNPGAIVQNVRSLDKPLGHSVATGPASGPRSSLFSRVLSSPQALAERFYIGLEGRATRLEVVLAMEPFMLGTMQTVQEMRSILTRLLLQQPLQAQDGRTVAARAYLGGSTAEMLDIRDVTRGDFRRISVLVLAVILVVVTLLVRDLPLAAFMLGCTVLSYLATLGASYWFFRAISSLFHLTAYAALDWKVEVFLFVVIVAVGQDYNIFLIGRLKQEALSLPPRAAARAALVYTGPVISSCGLIMAATLGSLAAGNLVLLVELGFALALGMLVDTFLVRPLLLPAFCALTGRTGNPKKGLGTSGFGLRQRPEEDRRLQA